MNDQNNENNPVATDEAANGTQQADTQQASTEQTVEKKAKKTAAKAAPVKVLTAFQKLDLVRNQQLKNNIPQFRVGDTLKVHVRIVEGNKERIQVFEGLVIKRNGGLTSEATFTVRKVSYNVGVERTFLVHSPRVEKIEVMTHGVVRRARLFYLRPLRGKAARIKTKFMNKTPETVDNSSVAAANEAAA